jgi:hypothetical protein
MGIPLRKSKKLPQRNFIHIYSNGHTEFEYFNLKKNELGIRNIVVKPIFENAGNPKQMLKKIAKNYFSSDFQEKDRVFCVIDMDETTNLMIQDGLKIKAKFIELILSNPNFEIWFLLHFNYYSSAIMMEETFSKLQEHIPNYSKTEIKSFFNVLQINEQKAIIHAKRLRKYYNDSEIDLLTRQANPCTTVDIIVDLLNSSL